MLGRFAVALLLLSGFGVMGADEGQPARLWLQNTAEIQHCLLSAGDVGCGVFECFENNSCEIRGLQEICMTFLHSAGKLDAQGKSFIKDALRCMAHGLKFSCISRRCLAIKEMIFQLQRECYRKHNLCSAAEDNVRVMVEMIQFQNLLPKGPYVELVNILLSCSEEVKEAIIRSVQSQCEQNWGALCDSLTFCSSITVAPASGSSRGPERRPAGSSHSGGQHLKDIRQGDKDKTNKNGFSSHARGRSQSPRRAAADGRTAEHKHSKITDIQR